jgi:secreted trypsin-like serine protease
VVGFGLPGPDVDAVLRKRQGFARISGFEIDRFSVDGEPSQPCLGDSGGPAFIRDGEREPIAGVHSGGGSDCSGGAYETRVAVHLPFIDAHLGTTAYGTRSTPAGLTSSTTCSVSAGRRGRAGDSVVFFLSAIVALVAGRRAFR